MTAVRLDFEEDTSVKYLSSINPFPLGSKPLHPAPGIYNSAQSQPSLDDVYLQATGKTLLDAEISMTGKRDLKKESKQSMR